MTQRPSKKSSPQKKTKAKSSAARPFVIHVNPNGVSHAKSYGKNRGDERNKNNKTSVKSPSLQKTRNEIKRKTAASKKVSKKATNNSKTKKSSQGPKSKGAPWKGKPTGSYLKRPGFSLDRYNP